MSKKTWYSRTLQYFWDKYHRDYEKLELDSTSLYVKLKRDIYALDPKRFSPEERQREILGTELWWADFKKETTHLFFVDKYLKDFLRETSLSDLEGVKRFLRDSGSSEEVSIIGSRERELITIYSFAIHVPYEKDGYAFSLGLDQSMKVTLLFCMGDTLSSIPEDRYAQLTRESDKLSKFNAATFRLAVNTLAYMNCFPECVSEGVPKNVPEDYSEREARIIGVSEKVLETESKNENGTTVQPHFRKGHFRLLKSDFYTEKRGQIVFVRETMVKGQAKTIHTADDLSRLK